MPRDNPRHVVQKASPVSDPLRYHSPGQATLNLGRVLVDESAFGKHFLGSDPRPVHVPVYNIQSRVHLMTQPAKKHDRDEKIKIPLDPEEALRGLLAVDPDAPPVAQNDDNDDDESLREQPEGT